MKSIKGNDEFKQRINLSNYAVTVLQQDRENFLPSSTVAGFYNDIIKGYQKQARASINNRVQVHQEYLKQTLSGFDQDSDLDDIIHKLVVEYRKKLIQDIENKSFPKGESILFRLNKANFEMLYGEEGTDGVEAENYTRPSLYLKALFEEFARLPNCTREEFYYRELIEDINDSAIVNGYLLEVVVDSQKYWIRPYKILPDVDGAHLYLAGYSKNVNRKEEKERIASFRFSGLQGNIRQLKDVPPCKLNKDEVYDIEDKIRKVGVQYLLAEQSPVVKLRFHNNGEKMFRRITHLRPVPIESPVNGVYTFDCSMMQIENYFFSFGRNVEILEPEKLRKEFMLAYQKAADLYEEKQL